MILIGVHPALQLHKILNAVASLSVHPRDITQQAKQAHLCMNQTNAPILAPHPHSPCFKQRASVLLQYCYSTQQHETK